MADQQYAAEFSHVTLRRGDVLALDDVTVSMPSGRTTAVLGASGSGKSTLVQLIIGLLEPDSGSVRALGAPVDYRDPRPLRRRVGYAIQDVALLPHLRIRDNILLPAKLNDWSAADKDARLAELMALMRLPDDVLARFPHELSGGQQQRAGLCRAMMLRPELLLLDEPFSGLDALTRQGIHERFRELKRREGISAVLVTHDPQEAINLAEFMIVMRAGSVLQHGTVRDVTEHPADDYVQKLCTGLADIGP